MKRRLRIIAFALAAAFFNAALVSPAQADHRFIVEIAEAYEKSGNVYRAIEALKEKFVGRGWSWDYDARFHVIRTLMNAGRFSTAYDMAGEFGARIWVLSEQWRKGQITLEELEMRTALDLIPVDQEYVFRYAAENLIGRGKFSEVKLFLRKYSREEWARMMMQQLAFAVSRESVQGAILLFSEPGVDETETILMLASHHDSSARITDAEVADFLLRLKTAESRSGFLYSLTIDVINRRDAVRAKYFIALVPLEEMKAMLLSLLRDMKK